MTYVQLLVEGDLDEAVGRRIVRAAGAQCPVVYGKQGAGYIQKKIAGFNGMAQAQPILALVDLMDVDSECPVDVVQTWLPRRNTGMIFRVVVREIESWILADRKGVASFLRTPWRKVPADPETLDDPKRTVINLARRSNSKTVRNNLVPKDPASNQEGPAYTSMMSRFVQNQWDLDVAMRQSDSLRRCVDAVRDVV